MPRRRVAEKREVLPDPIYNNTLVTRFINNMMWSGKRSTSEGILYGALTTIQDKTQDDPLKVFKKALENVKPLLEVKSRRVGGATYQVPVEVKPARRQSLASRWLIESARGRPEHSMAERLAAEMIEHVPHVFRGRARLLPGTLPEQRQVLAK